MSETKIRTDGGEENNPVVSGIISLILPGIGDIYNGETKRGAIIFVIWMVVGIIWWLIIMPIVGTLTLGLGLLVAPLFFILNLIAGYVTYSRTQKINSGEITVE